MDFTVQGLEYWHWLTFGILLLIAEVAVAGTSFLMWIGIAALITGVVSLILPGVMIWQLQLLVFGVACVGSVLLWRRYVKDVPVKGGATLNLRGADFIGRVVPLEEPIVGGSGRIRIDDTLWTVRGADAPAGTLVRITGQNGIEFDVTPA